MSQKFKELNGDSNSNNGNNRNGTAGLENGNDLNVRKAALTPLEFRVTQQRETERPFSNKYNKFWETGTYHCVVCDAELFKSETKFESKSGWPAFYNVVDPQRVKLTPDVSHVGANLLLLIAKPDLARTEVSCASCNAHLGHLFKDGPKPTGLRYCINSSSLKFKNEDGITIMNNTISTPTAANGNGSLTNSNPIREYICNPENTCSRPPSVATTPVSVSSTPTGAKDFRGKTARDQFFSSSFTPDMNGSSLPPMGALCLNNQSCQRVAPVTPKKPPSQDILKSSIISNGAENNANNVSIKTSSSCTTNGTGTENLPSAKTNPTSIIVNNTTTTTSTTTTTPLPPKARYPFSSKGASLTAARINFFQKMSSKQDSSSSPSRWAVTFNSRWSSNKSSSSNPSSNNTHPENNHHRIQNGINSSPFPSSCSSGSLCTVLKQPRPDEFMPPFQGRRSTSSFFTNSSSASISTPPVEQVSTPPRTVALRETTL